MNLMQEPPMPPMEMHDNGLGETAHVFGDGLVGVLHRAAPPDRRGGTAVLLLNAGLVHRVGPYRGSVQLARALAGEGYDVLRFDLSGLGDSPLSPRADTALRQAEVAAAIDLVAAETGARRFVVGGICSAADNAFHAAARDPRIHGLLLLDGLAYRTPGWWLRHLPPRLLHPGKVWRWLRQRDGGRPALADFRDFPARGDAVAALRDMVARDVRLLFVFTGGAYAYFNHPGQLAACLGRAARSPQVALAHWPDCDHTFYLQRDRSRLQREVLAWLRDVSAAPSMARRPT